MCDGRRDRLQVVWTKLVTPFVSAIAQEIVSVFSSAFNDKRPEHLEVLGRRKLLGFGKFVANFLNGKGGTGALPKLLWAVIRADAEALPKTRFHRVGWAMFGVSVAVGVASLLETSIEVALSPKTYVWELGFTHDITVTVTHDSTNSAFPADATHCIVTATFGDAIPHRQTLSMNGRDLTKPITSRFPACRSAAASRIGGFIQQALPGQASILLGKGSTGNLVNGPPSRRRSRSRSCRFRSDRRPIYRHRRKTALTAAGMHYWNTTAAPPVATQPACAEAGHACAS